jgi:hypothetical protein
MKHSTFSSIFPAQLMLVFIIVCAGCKCGSGTTTPGNSVSANGKVSMTVSANPVIVNTNGTTTVTANVTNLQLDGVTWQPANGARVVFRLRLYPGHACGGLVGVKTIQTDANGDASITFKASNAPTTSGGDTCFVWVVADRTFTVGTDSNVSDSVTLKIY